MSNQDNFDFNVSVSAQEWAYNQRRIKYLETLLIRLLRDKTAVKEWFSSAELTDLQLPGLPPTRGAISRKAKTANWIKKKITNAGQIAFAFHISSLPAKAFDELLSQLLGMPPIDDEIEQLQTLPSAQMPIPPPQNTAPAWVLPLMRLMKGEAKGNLGVAWQKLPNYLPKGTELPSINEAAETLVRLGVVKA